MNNSIAVVTAVTGGYDYMGHHSAYNENVDYIFYTDGLSEPLDKNWNVQILPSDYTSDKRKLAKIPKINPHHFELLRSYRYVIWIDGSMQIKNHNFVQQILFFLHNGLLLSPHFDNRDCGYGEATIRPPKYAMEPLDEQVAAYKKAGFPENYGLWECGIQARDMSFPGLQEFGQIWLQEILDWTIQDQVSCGYSLWKSGFIPDVLPKSWREYDWVHLNAHTREVH